MDINEISNLVTTGTLTGILLGTAYLYHDAKKTMKNSEKLRKETENQALEQSVSKLEYFLEDSKLNKQVATKVFPNLRIKQLSEPKPVSEGVEYHFSINGKEYLHTEELADSNSINLPKNHYRNIENLVEREVVRLAYQHIKFA